MSIRCEVQAKLTILTSIGIWHERERGKICLKDNMERYATIKYTQRMEKFNEQENFRSPLSFVREYNLLKTSGEFNDVFAAQTKYLSYLYMVKLLNWSLSIHYVQIDDFNQHFKSE